MCGIDFVIAVTDKEASMAEEYVRFEEKIHDYLIRETKKKDPLTLLIQLDRYKRTVLNAKEINELIVICEELLKRFYVETEINHAIRDFAQDLKELCQEAIEQKKHLYAIGD